MQRQNHAFPAVTYLPRLFLLTCILGSVIASPFATAANTATPRTLKICHEPADIHPWADRQGGGLDYYLLNKTAKTLKLNFEYVIVPWKRCLAMLKANEVDGAFAGSFKADRLESAAYPGISLTSDPKTAVPDATKRLHIDRYVLVRNKSTPFSWDGKTISKLHDAIGVQRGYSVTDQLNEMGVVVDDGSQTAQDLLRKLVHARLGAAALLEGEAKTIISHNPELITELEILTPPLVEKAYYLLLSHELVGKEPAFANTIWATIEHLRNAPAYKAMERKILSGASAK